MGLASTLPYRMCGAAVSLCRGGPPRKAIPGSIHHSALMAHTHALCKTGSVSRLAVLVAGHAGGTPPSPPRKSNTKVPKFDGNSTVCLCLRVFNFSDASFKNFGLIFEISIGASKIKN